MNLDFNVQRKFKINGKEYNSIEEMPDNVREILQRRWISSQAREEALILQ